MLLFPDGMLGVVVPLVRPVFGPGGCGSALVLYGAVLVLCTTCGVALLASPRLGAWWCAAMGAAPAVLWLSDLLRRDGGRVVAVVAFAGVQVLIVSSRLRSATVQPPSPSPPADPIG